MKMRPKINFIRPLFAQNSARAYCSDPVHASLSGPIRVRFAPSPTGAIHLGGARTALYNWMFAKKYNGEFLLRIEDTDRTRLVSGSQEQILSDLHWLGLDHQGDLVTQSLRQPIYKQHAERLVTESHAYRCFCTTVQGIYDNRCRKLDTKEAELRAQNGEKHTIRFKLRDSPNQVHDLICGLYERDIAKDECDPVILKSDGMPTYHLANVVDDHQMEISHVIRGEDWLVSVIKHIQLYSAFDWTPPCYLHLPLIQTSSGQNKLSKRDKSASLSNYRQMGYSPLAIVNYLTRNGFLMKNRNERKLYSLEELADLLHLRSDLSRMNIKTDLDRLDYYGQLNIGKMNRQTLIAQLRQFMGDVSYLDGNESLITDQYIERVLDLCKEREKPFSHMGAFFGEEMKYLWIKPTELSDFDLIFKGKAEKFLDDSRMIIGDLREMLSEWDIDDLQFVGLRERLFEYAQKKQLKKAYFMRIIRLCLILSKSGQPIDLLVQFFGRDECLERLRLAEMYLNGK